MAVHRNWSKFVIHNGLPKPTTMYRTLRTTVTVLLFVFCIQSKDAQCQSSIQYAIVDYEYTYNIVIENVTDDNDSKLPIALLHGLSGVMPQFDPSSSEIAFSTKKNLSKPSIIALLEEHNYNILQFDKKETNKSAESEEE